MLTVYKIFSRKIRFKEDNRYRHYREDLVLLNSIRLINTKSKSVDLIERGERKQGLSVLRFPHARLHSDYFCRMNCENSSTLR